ncbi:MAG: type 2 isopentenyl-diphosphate Delta-isomerase [Candidatus Heimdallarchaeota archaeon]|nr:type 2 isopentenyl-diphosphate Delta-isomerase [Candidatus Heimdallarchaeota archaeon]
MDNDKTANQTTNRKLDHIDICCNFTQEVEMTKTTGFEDLEFVHNALPNVDFDAIDLSTSFLKHQFKYPIFISSITGGTEKARKMNGLLAQIAENFGIGIGVGSQRAALEDESKIESFSIIREKAPNAFVGANLGAIQFNNSFTITHAQKAIEMINADALILHLNPLQELVQPEGDTNFNNLISKIKEIGKKLKKPLIVKEVGSGISYEIARQLIEYNVKAIDIAGAGGTSWSQIEAIRARQQGFTIQAKIGELLKNWGIPTAASTIEVAALADKVEIISSGGIRNGLEAAKAIAIGAKLVGIALPLAYLASTGTEKQITDWLKQFIYELRTVMFLTSCANVDDLHRARMTVIGKTAEWLSARGFIEELEQINLRG